MSLRSLLVIDFILSAFPLRFRAKSKLTRKSAFSSPILEFQSGCDLFGREFSLCLFSLAWLFQEAQQDGVAKEHSSTHWPLRRGTSSVSSVQCVWGPGGRTPILGEALRGQADHPTFCSPLWIREHCSERRREGPLHLVSSLIPGSTQHSMMSLLLHLAADSFRSNTL